jgi:putative spermidine/putrescine transport system permease protein
MTTVEAPLVAAPPVARPPRRRSVWAWVGVLPFFIFAILFIGFPAMFLVVGSLIVEETGSVGLDNFAGLTGPCCAVAFRNSIQLSLITAIIGALFGLLLAAAVILGPAVPALGLTFSGVASNFAGIPLALAFIFTLGNLGLVTKIIQDIFGFRLQDTGFSLYTLTGLAVVYLYFQFPLMVLVIAPAIEGLRKEWREAAENLGATPAQYWRKVALPILCHRSWVPGSSCSATRSAPRQRPTSCRVGRSSSRPWSSPPRCPVTSCSILVSATRSPWGWSSSWACASPRTAC